MSSTTSSPSSQHVLVIGIDGVRYDTLTELPTPNIDSIAAAGFLSPVRVNDAGPTISGPSWATIFTGVLADRHNIFNNEFAGHRLAEFPEIIRLAQTFRPGLPVFVGAAWQPLVAAVGGGPMFADGGFQPTPPDGDWGTLDEQVTDAAVDYLTNHDGQRGSLAVCYLGAPDEIAHADGVGPSYRTSITDSDARVGRLLAAIQQRTDEDWTVIAVTDHGHVDAGGHGGDTDEERTAWMAARGPGITAAPADLQQADVAAHVLSTLQVPEADWQYMTGRPLDRRQPE